MAGEFKQQCPSCEAMVSIKDETLIGKKTECTKCKFRFLVEAPSKGKPADDKKAPPVKSKAAGKEAAAKAKQEIKKAESGQKAPSKAGAKNKQMLIIGGAVGGVALVAIVAAMFLFSGGEDSSKTKVAEKGKRNRPTPVTPNGPNDKPEETPEEKPKEEEKAPVVAKSDGVDPDVSIRLPSDSKVVAIIKMESFFNSMLAKVLFTTPGAFNTKDFAKTFGVPLESIEQIMLAKSSMLPDFNPLKKSWKMAILRSKEPFKKAYMEKSLSLTQELPLEGLLWSKIAGQLDSLSSLMLGFESNEKLSFFLADSRTIVIASEEKMNDYLKKDKGKPKKIAMAAPPPETPKPVDPNNPMPPMPMPPGSPPPMPMPNGQPVDPNAPPMPVAPPVSVKGNHYETLPLRFAKVMQISEEGDARGGIMIVGVDLGELAAVIPIASAFLSTYKTPGGAPIPPDIVNQIKNLSKLEYALLSVNKSNLDEQGFALIAVSRDRKVASDFVKLAFPLVKNIPLALKEAKLDISARTEDKTGGDPSAAPNPNAPPPGSGGAEERIQPGAHGLVRAMADYDPITSSMGMGFMVGLKLPPAMLKSFEGSLGEYLVTLKNNFETKTLTSTETTSPKELHPIINFPIINLKAHFTKFFRIPKKRTMSCQSDLMGR